MRTVEASKRITATKHDEVTAEQREPQSPASTGAANGLSAHTGDATAAPTPLAETTRRDGEGRRVAIFDVGGTFIKVGIVEHAQLRTCGRVPTPQDTQEHFLKAIEGALAELGTVDGVAFSLPGIIDVDRRYMVTGGSLIYNYQVDATQWEDHLGLPIEIENDARCSALAELVLGSMQGVQTGLVATFGTGVGGGIIVDGHVHKGGHLMAGEISFCIVDDPRRKDQAMLGAISSVKTLVSAVGEASGVPCADGEEAFARMDAGDVAACVAFDAWCDDLAREFFNIQCTLDPERVALGGGVSANPRFIDGVKDGMERFYRKMDGFFPFAMPRVEIVPCRFRNAANLLGAYLNFAEHRNISCAIDVSNLA